MTTTVSIALYIVISIAFLVISAKVMNSSGDAIQFGHIVMSTAWLIYVIKDRRA